MARVSIVMPAFNAAGCIEEALQSIFSQKYFDVEIIVVDDGSTDSTRDILRKYVDTGRLRYLYQQNAGPGAARNKGLSEAKGDFICFLDADDELIEESLASRVDFLDKNPNVGLVFTDFYKVNTPGVFRSHADLNKFLTKFDKAILSNRGKNYIFGDKFFECALEFEPFILTSTVMLKAEVARAVGNFNTKLKVAEDSDYWLRICRKYNVGFINKPLTKYNNFRSGLTSNKIKAFEDPIVFYSQLLNELETNEKYKALLRKKIARIEFDYGYYLSGEGKFSESKKHYRRSFFLFPLDSKSIKWAIASLLPSSIISALFALKNKAKSEPS